MKKVSYDKMEERLVVSYHGDRLKSYIENLNKNLRNGKLALSDIDPKKKIELVIQKDHLPNVTPNILLKLIRELSNRDDWDILYLSEFEYPVEYIDPEELVLTDMHINKVPFTHKKDVSYITNTSIHTGNHVIALFPIKPLFYKDNKFVDKGEIISFWWYLGAIMITIIIVYVLHYKNKKIHT